MKNNRWLLGLVLIATLIATLLVIGNNQSKLHIGKTNLKVGIFEVVRHPVLDAMADAFRKSLEEKFPKKIDFVTMVPEGDAAKTEQMAQKFATDRFDLVFVIGTEQAKSLASKTKSLPIVLGAATDPKSAGLVDSWENPGGNVTGTSDLSPIDVQLDRLAQIMPNAKRIGVIYNTQEENSNIIVSRFKMECEKRGLVPVLATISNQNEIKQTLVSLVGKIDVLYAPTDATLQKGFTALMKVSNEVNIPVFNCDESTTKEGAIFSVGFNYLDLGRISAEMATKILNREAMPSNMPIRIADRFTLFYNTKQIERYKLPIPDPWKSEGKQVN